MQHDNSQVLLLVWNRIVLDNHALDLCYRLSSRQLVTVEIGMLMRRGRIKHCAYLPSFRHRHHPMPWISCRLRWQLETSLYKLDDHRPIHSSSLVNVDWAEVSQNVKLPLGHSRHRLALTRNILSCDLTGMSQAFRMQNTDRIQTFSKNNMEVKPPGKLVFAVYLSTQEELKWRRAVLEI